MSKFNTSNIIGQQGEAQVTRVFENLGCTVQNVGSSKAAHDLIITHEGKTFRIEVKNDVMSMKTGNFFFEYKAVKSCTADFMCFIHGVTLYLWPTSYVQGQLDNRFLQDKRTTQDKVGSKVEYRGRVYHMKKDTYHLHAEEIINYWI